MAKKKYQSAKVKLFMKNLGITEQEAEELIEFDKSVAQTEGLTDVFDEYDIQTHSRISGRKPKPERSEIINEIITGLQDFVENIKVLNPERQISFVKNGKTYEITLTKKNS